MYESFYGFRERPFDLTPNPRFLVMTDVHREALSNLEYGISSRTGITLLVGEAGTGKTTLIRTALERQPARVHCVHIQNPVLTRDEFVEMLALRFQLSSRARESKTTLLFELEEALKHRDVMGESTVLLVDEAQSLPRDILEEIRLLANIETTERKLLSVILAGQPEVTALLNDPNLRQLKQRIALRCELRPLTLQETAGLPGWTNSRRRRRGRAGLHPRGRDVDPRAIGRRATHDQRDRRQLAAHGLCRGSAPGEQRHRARGVPRLRPRRRIGSRVVGIAAGRHATGSSDAGWDAPAGNRGATSEHGRNPRPAGGASGNGRAARRSESTAAAVLVSERVRIS